MSSFLVVDENQELREQIKRHFKTDSLSIDDAFDYSSAQSFINQHIYDVILSDAHISGGSLTDLLHLRRLKNSQAMMIISTNSDSVNQAIQAIDLGAFDFITKPYTIHELHFKVQKAFDAKRLKNEADHLRGDRNIIYNANNFIGESPEIKKVFDKVIKAAHNTYPILLVGEVGTGKDLLAGAIHYNSERCKGAFVKVNCAALTEQQLDSELFGRSTEASHNGDKLRVGRIEQADGGTIFINAIEQMSPIIQGKLLHVLHDKRFERCGGTQSFACDVRFIFATSRDLVAEIEKGRFRKDLYHWIKGNTIQITPLRKRKGDIILLTYYYLKKACGDFNKKISEIQPMAVKLLTDYSWPGNGHELRNTIEHAVLTVQSDTIKPEDLRLPTNFQPNGWDQNLFTLFPKGLNLEEIEKDLVMQGLKMCDWVKKEAAVVLGVTEEVLQYKIKRFGITHPTWK
jgi:DNA-binding NtrC family response regulator